ncbi:Outer membrane cobalamin receptor protein [Saccharicrinis carchari]|uniref:Outer membrane cobalamin receptor protein n=1 Tax=Saccharicrinis carchari TaxID=1168039 RepID=A0A521EJY0_SACCC|nr:TonB-dependent receptor [Saccharicrinis carchari]SMO84227.1 Outer membrane cobalamin receptor protein [Saccharicrinis carchari]
MRALILPFIFLIALNAVAQTTVTGKVTDKKGEPLVGVNIYFKDTYDGGVSDSNGNFKVSTRKKGNLTLLARFIGYKTFVQVLAEGKQQIAILLKEDTQSIDAVTVTAGTFAAGDKHKASLLKTLDIYTTAGSLGDITNALNTLPGTQQANDDGRLLVRGGDAYETRTLIDGVLAGKPYYSKVPDVKARGRFSPSLFSGVLFNTGGYSAEYGQALSSVLVLESNDLFTEDRLSLSLMSVGAELNYTEAWKNNSISILGSYTNLAPYFGMANTRLNWEKPTEALQGSVIYRHKTKKNGMLKAYFTGDGGTSRFNSDTGIDDGQYSTESTGRSYYGNVTYRQPLGQSTALKAGTSVTLDNPDIRYATQRIKNKEVNLETKLMLISEVSDGVVLKYGVSNTASDYHQQYRAHPDSVEYNPYFRDYLTAAFAEAHIQVSKNLALSSGLRWEYSSLLKRNNVAPRIGLAAATGRQSQVSASYGHFYQNPHPDELKFSSDLNFERADHYILGFQSGATNKRFLRLESYYKKYTQLVKYEGRAFYSSDYYSNKGNGYALGIDLFWRDNESVRFLEYWLSYAYVDTRRKYKSFDFRAQPDFVSRHNFSVVGKYWMSAIHCQLGATYWMASGRNWYERTAHATLSHQADLTHELNLSLSYITQFFSKPAIVHVSLSNALGTNNVYGYREGPIRNVNGSTVYLPITNYINQFAFIGIFITLI